MSPSDILLAKQECDQLLRQGLIESTTSDWACQAFYVEKKSELVPGKKRLVIDYQPLNAFLRDDKFPLPKIQSLFVHLQGATVFSQQYQFLLPQPLSFLPNHLQHHGSLLMIFPDTNGQPDTKNLLHGSMFK